MILKLILGDLLIYYREGTQKLRYAPIIVFEGILSFYDKPIRDLMDLKIYVYTDDDERLRRRLIRDVEERNRSIESVLKQYNETVKKSYDEFIKPTMKYADIILPRGKSNEAGIKLIFEDICTKLRTLGISPRIPEKRMNFTCEPDMIKELKEHGIKNVLTLTEDKDMQNEIITKWLMRKEFIFNKYHYLFNIGRG